MTKYIALVCVALCLLACFLSSCSNKRTVNLSANIKSNQVIVAEEIRLLPGFTVQDGCSVMLYARKYFFGPGVFRTEGSLEINGIGQDAAVTADIHFRGFLCSSWDLDYELIEKANYNRVTKVIGIARVKLSGLRFNGLRTAVLVSIVSPAVKLHFQGCQFNDCELTSIVRGSGPSIVYEDVDITRSRIGALYTSEANLSYVLFRRVRTSDESLRCVTEVPVGAELSFGAFLEFDSCYIDVQSIECKVGTVVVDASEIRARSVNLVCGRFEASDSLISCNSLRVSSALCRVAESVIQTGSMGLTQVSGQYPTSTEIVLSLLCCDGDSLESFLSNCRQLAVHRSIFVPRGASLDNPVALDIHTAVLSKLNDTILLGSFDVLDEAPPGGVLTRQIVYDGKAWLFAFSKWSVRFPAKFPPRADSLKGDLSMLLEAVFSNQSKTYVQFRLRTISSRLSSSELIELRNDF